MGCRLSGNFSVRRGLARGGKVCFSVAGGAGVPEYPSGHLGEILAFLRKQAGLNLFELKRKSGVTDSSILRIERGDTQSPRADSCVKLARALDLPWVFFLTLAGRMIPAEDAFQGRVFSYLSTVRAWWRGELRGGELSPEAREDVNDEYLKLQDLFLGGTSLELNVFNEDVSRQPAARILARALADGGDAAFALWFAGRIPQEFLEHDRRIANDWEEAFVFGLDENIARQHFISFYYSRPASRTVIQALLSLYERKQKKIEQLVDPSWSVSAAYTDLSDAAAALLEAYVSASRAAAKVIEPTVFLARRLRELGVDFKPLREMLSDMLPSEALEELFSPKAPRKPRKPRP